MLENGWDGSESSDDHCSSRLFLVFLSTKPLDIFNETLEHLLLVAANLDIFDEMPGLTRLPDNFKLH